MFAVTISKEKPDTKPLREHILDKAYYTPNYNTVGRFNTPLMCQTCGSEFIYVLAELPTSRQVCCGQCGTQFLAPTHRFAMSVSA